MTKKKHLSPVADDDYYVVERARIAEEAKNAHRMHEKEVNSHLNAVIPYYEEADEDEAHLLVLLNNLLVNRFREIGLVYWNIFRHAPIEIREYSDMFWNDLSPTSVEKIITFLENKKNESVNLVDIWFDDQDIGDGFGVVGEGDDSDVDGEEEREQVA